MSAQPARLRAVVEGPLDDFTQQSLRAVVAEAPHRVSIRFEPWCQPVVTPVTPPAQLNDPSIAKLIQTAAFETGVSIARIKGDGRSKPDVRARTAVCWGARELLGKSFKVIGNALGGCDHTTIIFAMRRAEALLARDPAFRLLADRLRVAMGAGQ